jgi:eukaryotic-like serine/threonine-protein kinase
MLLQPTQPTDLILGYTLREKIGSGGYGEVWSAEAPGGLKKAIKLIYGFHDETRAQRELKALNRVKQVRHPFLLSLERIDIVDGRLVVVTELAEQSLKDRFRECLQNGEVGIPRDELVAYLCDAAEAIDFLYESHSLLHLDIKPENLLLMGGHVKLADFGLVKDMLETSVSLMGGMTPTYAAPEVFDGRPTSQSDQYSLAIVFQEMLTGKRPFSGTTPAKLALEHLHEPPDLSQLSPGDQEALRRGLAKSPATRFPNCRAFMEDLTRCRSRPRRRKPETPPSTGNVQTPVDTFCNTVATPLGGVIGMAPKLGEVKLPPCEWQIDEASFRPTLFIGIGQTATSVLRQLKRRFHERLGDEGCRRALQILCLDTDPRDLIQATTSAGADSLGHDEILPLPLKSPGEYRDNAEAHFAWLSRRWIYNIPRSRQTEGLRPLGRLAFVDHHEQIFDRLHRVIEQMTDPEAVRHTADACQMPTGDTSPRVVIVASISGGTGSGMVADMAYTARMVLAERGLNDFPVCGILLYASGRSSTRRDITVANAYCCLSELYHFSRESGFPGDPSCDLPAFEDRPAFDDTYVIDMGSDLLADEYTAMADGLAEYLFLDAATPCGSYLSAVREQEVDDGRGMHLRTIGASYSGSINGDAVSMAARVVCQHLLRNWLGEARVGSSGVVDGQRRGVLDRDAELDGERIAATVREAVARSLENDAFELVQRRLESYCQSWERTANPPDAAGIAQEVDELVDKSLGIDRARPTTAFSAPVNHLAESVVSQLEQQILQQIQVRVLGRLDQTGHRLGEAEAAQREVVRQLSLASDLVTVRLRGVRERLSSLSHEIQHDVSGRGAAKVETSSRDLTEWVRQYARQRTQEFLLGCAQRVVSRVASQSDSLTIRLASVRQSLTKLADEFQHHHASEVHRNVPGAMVPHTVVSSLYLEDAMASIDELASQLDRTAQEQCFQPNGGFCSSQDDQGDQWTLELARLLYRHARSLLAARVCAVGFDSLWGKCGVTDDQTSKWVEDSLKLARPNLLTSCGGQSSLVLALPRGSQGQSLQPALNAQDASHAKRLAVSDGDVTFCYDVGGIPIHHVATLLLQSCPRSADIISRLQTRNDIKWTPLIQLD